eukprot:2173085-Rhodomonas_salina.1
MRGDGLAGSCGSEEAGGCGAGVGRQVRSWKAKGASRRLYNALVRGLLGPTLGPTRCFLFYTRV